LKAKSAATTTKNGSNKPKRGRKSGFMQPIQYRIIFKFLNIQAISNGTSLDQSDYRKN
jgi:hypothetical protein